MERKPVIVNPIKTSPPIGAAMALQGIKGALALFHASPGCTFLGKVLLTAHLREPIGLIGTDIKEIPLVMGGCDDLKKKIIEADKKFNPSLIGVIGTSISEIRGEDMEMAVKEIRNEVNAHVISIRTPDYTGGFANGYAMAIESMISGLAAGGETIPKQVAILPSPSLTIADLEELKDTAAAFGLKSVFLPDFSLSMDGSKEKFSTLPLGGTALEEIISLGRSTAVIAVGKSMKKSGATLGERFGIPFYHVPLPIGLDATDEFIRTLISISGDVPPEKIRRWRKRLIDGMIDSHLATGGKSVAIGLDTELLSAVAGLCAEVGINVKAAASDCVSAERGLGLKAGCDLGDMEDGAAGVVNLVISNSHGKEASSRLGVPLLEMGFPVIDSFGETMKLRAGYQGTLSFLFEMANAFKERQIKENIWA